MHYGNEERVKKDGGGQREKRERREKRNTYWCLIDLGKFEVFIQMTSSSVHCTQVYLSSF